MCNCRTVQRRIKGVNWMLISLSGEDLVRNIALEGRETERESECEGMVQATLSFYKGEEPKALGIAVVACKWESKKTALLLLLFSAWWGLVGEVDGVCRVFFWGSQGTRGRNVGALLVIRGGFVATAAAAAAERLAVWLSYCPRGGHLGLSSSCDLVIDVLPL